MSPLTAAILQARHVPPIACRFDLDRLAPIPVHQADQAYFGLEGEAGRFGSSSRYWPARLRFSDDGGSETERESFAVGCVGGLVSLADTESLEHFNDFADLGDLRAIREALQHRAASEAGKDEDDLIAEILDCSGVESCPELCEAVEDLLGGLRS